MQDLAAELTFLFCYVEEGSFSARRSSEWHKPLACLLPGFRSPKVSFRALIPWRTWKLCTMALHNSLSLCQVMSNSLWPHGLQHARLLHPSLSSRIRSNSCPLSWWCHPTISSSVSPSPSPFNLSQHQGLFQWVSSSHQVAKVLEFQVQHQSFQWIFRTDFL